eukprot:769266-Rhodomonas_salina.3
MPLCFPGGEDWTEMGRERLEELTWRHGRAPGYFDTASGAMHRAQLELLQRVESLPAQALAQTQSPKLKPRFSQAQEQGAPCCSSLQPRVRPPPARLLSLPSPLHTAILSPPSLPSPLPASSCPPSSLLPLPSSPPSSCSGKLSRRARSQGVEQGRAGAHRRSLQRRRRCSVQEPCDAASRRWTERGAADQTSQGGREDGPGQGEPKKKKKGGLGGVGAFVCWQAARRGAAIGEPGDLSSGCSTVEAEGASTGLLRGVFRASQAGARARGSERSFGRRKADSRTAPRAGCAGERGARSEEERGGARRRSEEEEGGGEARGSRHARSLLRSCMAMALGPRALPPLAVAGSCARSRTILALAVHPRGVRPSFGPAPTAPSLCASVFSRGGDESCGQPCAGDTELLSSCFSSALRPLTAAVPCCAGSAARQRGCYGDVALRLRRGAMLWGSDRAMSVGRDRDDGCRGVTVRCGGHDHALRGRDR